MNDFKKAVVATVFCNSLIWYDYALYGSLVGVISFLFFPDGNSKTQFLSAFAVFAVGFIARPIGSVFFGHIGDRYGRRVALLLSVISMSLPVGLIGVLPTYQSIGVSATLMLILVRVLQGFSLGGEAGNAIFLMEFSPKNRVGLYGSLEVVSALIGALISTIVVFVCKVCIGIEGFISWGWRLPFLFGAVIGVFGSVLRYHVAETPEFEKQQETDRRLPIKELLTKYKKTLLLAIGIDSVEETSLYMFLIFVQGYLFSAFVIHGIPTEVLYIILLCLLAVLTLGFALLSDFIGRKKVLFFGFVSAILFSYPVFKMIESESFLNIIFAQVLLIITISASLGPISAAVSKMLPTRISYTGLALSRNISAAIFGGFAPTASMFLVDWTGQSSSASLYLIFSGFVGLTSLYFAKELTCTTSDGR